MVLRIKQTLQRSAQNSVSKNCCVYSRPPNCIVVLYKSVTIAALNFRLRSSCQLNYNELSQSFLFNSCIIFIIVSMSCICIYNAARYNNKNEVEKTHTTSIVENNKLFLTYHCSMFMCRYFKIVK